MLGGEALGEFLELEGRHSRAYRLAQSVEHVPDDEAGAMHGLELGG